MTKKKTFYEKEREWFKTAHPDWSIENTEKALKKLKMSREKAIKKFREEIRMAETPPPPPTMEQLQERKSPATKYQDLAEGIGNLVFQSLWVSLNSLFYLVVAVVVFVLLLPPAWIGFAGRKFRYGKMSPSLEIYALAKAKKGK